MGLARGQFVCDSAGRQGVVIEARLERFPRQEENGLQHRGLTAPIPQVRVRYANGHESGWMFEGHFVPFAPVAS